MKLLDKYPMLADAAVIEEMLTANLFATMSLENQAVNRTVLLKIVREAMEKRQSELSKFLPNQSGQVSQIA